MKVIKANGAVIDLGATEAVPIISMTDYSRRKTDDFGVTTVVKRSFARKMSVRFAVPFTDVDRVQGELAALRAIPVQWQVDEAFKWLDFKGFYKDFSIDLAVPPLSFCTLAVEGLAETEVVAETDSDPAVDGKSTLLVINPIVQTDATLINSNVPENDYPAWSVAATYALGARVIKAATHRIYESAVAANVGNDPAGAAGLWIDLGPTNRWAMFDQALGSVTTRDDNITVTLGPIGVNAIALLDVTAAAVRVQTGAYDQTRNVIGGAVSFLDMPGTLTSIVVTITGGGQVAVGTLLAGTLTSLGVTGDSPSAGITDFSKKQTDDFGEVIVSERSWAKKMSARALIKTSSIDIVANRIAALRGVPAFWVGDADTKALSIYGFFKDFSIEVGEAVSTLTLSIEGLSKAAYIAVQANILDIAEKKIFVTLEAARQLDILGIIKRGNILVPASTSAAALQAAINAVMITNNNWVTYRNSIIPAWNTFTEPSARDYDIWAGLNADLDAAISALKIAISEEDARRSAWPNITNRPPLTGTAQTPDEMTSDITRWTIIGNAAIVATSVPKFSATAIRMIGQSEALGEFVPIDHNAQYIAQCHMDRNAGHTGIFYLGVALRDANGANIAGDGYFWLYLTRTGSQQSASGVPDHCFRYFGSGTDKPFPTNAVSMAVLSLANFGGGGANRTDVDGLRINKLAAPLEWIEDASVVGNGSVVTHDGSIVGAGFNPSGWTRAVRTIVKRPSLRISGKPKTAINNYAMFGLADTVGSYYDNGDYTLFTDQTGTVFAQENASFHSLNTGYTEADTFAVEYDGGNVRYYKNDTLLRIIWAGPNRQFWGAAYIHGKDLGFVNVKVEPVKAASIVGANTFDLIGNPLGNVDLNNNAHGIVNGQYINPVGAGTGTEVANNRLDVDFDNLGVGGRPRVRLRRDGGNIVNSQFEVPTRLDNAAQQLSEVQGAGALAALNQVDLASDNVAGTLPVARADAGLRNDNLNAPIAAAALTAAYEQVSGRPAFLINPINVSGIDRIRASYLTDDAGLRDIQTYFPETINANNTALSQLAINGVDEIIINYDHANNAITNLPKTQSFIVTKGPNDVTSTSALSVAVKSGTIAASMSGGVLSIDKLSGVLTSAVIEISGTVTGGAVIPAKTVRITRSNLAPPTAPPPAPGSATTDSTAFTGEASSTTPSPQGRELTVVVGSNGAVQLTANYEFTCAQTTGTFSCNARWYKYNGSAYVAIGSTVNASAPFVGTAGDPGSGVCNHSDGGNASGSTQKYKLYMAASSGTISRSIYGDISSSGVNV